MLQPLRLLLMELTLICFAIGLVGGADVDPARRRDDRLALARKLEKYARETTDPIGRFVILDEARQLAEQAGEWKLSIAFIDEIARHYQIDELNRKAQSLESAVKRASTTQVAGLANEALELAGRSVSASDLVSAIRLTQSAQSAARKTRNTEAARRSISALRVLKKLESLSQAAQAARRELKANPENKEASLTWGRFLCIVRQDWDQGLEVAARGTGSWSRLARQEKTAKDDLSSHLSLANAWYKQAEESEGIDATAMKLRARYWYRIAESGKPTGVSRVQVDQRLQELASLSVVPGIETVAATAVTDTAPERPTVAGTGLREDRTPLAGGSGGDAFRSRVPEGSQLIGFRVSDSNPIHFIQPIYKNKDGVQRGPILGEETKESREIVAKNGYVVAGFVVKTGDFVKGLAVTFREANRQTKRFRWYDSPWIGDREEGKITRLGRPDLFVDGVYGRGKGLIDAIGLTGVTPSKSSAPSTKKE